MRRIVDLTLPIEEHWRYGIHFDLVKSHENGDPYQITGYPLQSHWFTHIDFPRHFDPTGLTSDDYPISDWGITDCLVLDLTDVPENTGITAEMLEKANEPFKDKHYDSILIRTDRANKVSWKTKDFWDNSQWVTEDGGVWIKNYAPKIVGYDFPQDYVIRIRAPKPGQDMRQPVHEHVLVEGKILQIEYMTNLWEIKSPTCQLIALPINTQHSDGGTIRVIAVVEE